jgi:hypothetical protein
MANRNGIVGSILAWLGTAWALFEQHYGAIAAAVAVLVSIFTMINIVKGWIKRK